MKVEFYRTARGESPIEKWIDGLPKWDQARVLDVLVSLESYGFDCPRVQFRQLRGKLWEIKFSAESGGFRVAYVTIHKDLIVWLHAFRKQSQKPKLTDLRLAEKRMREVLDE